MILFVRDEYLFSDLAAAHALILAERAARRQSEARAARAVADLSHAHATASNAEVLIARLRLDRKLRRTPYGTRSEPKERLVNQLEMQLGDVEIDATEDELAAERSTPSAVVKPFERKRPARQFFELADIATNARRGKTVTSISPSALEAVNILDTCSNRGGRYGANSRHAHQTPGCLVHLRQPHDARSSRRSRR
jgi:hypothetical protein